MNAEFKQWLENGAIGVFGSDNSTGLRYIALQKCKGIKCIYVLNDYRNYLEISNNFEFCGLYNENDGKVYLGNFLLEQISDDEKEETSINNLKRLAEKEFSKILNKKISTMVFSPNIEDIQDANKKHDTLYWLENHAYERARTCYIYDEIPYSPLTPSINLNNEKNLISYILTPIKFLDYLLNDYIKNKKDTIISNLLMNDAVQEKYNRLALGNDRNANIVKKIINAVKETGAKTVTIKIEKRGFLFEAKTEVQNLTRDPGADDTYRSYDFCAKDRKRWKEIFGWEGYKPEEIEKIVYKKKVIYEKEV